MKLLHCCTVCFMETVPSATCVLRDIKIVFITRVYTEGTVFMNPAVGCKPKFILEYGSGRRGSGTI